MANDDDLTEVEQHAYAHAEGWEHHYREEHKRVEALEAEVRALREAVRAMFAADAVLLAAPTVDNLNALVTAQANLCLLAPEPPEGA